MLMEKRKAWKKLDMKPRMKIKIAHYKDGQDKNGRHAQERRHGKKDQERRLRKPRQTWKMYACSFGDGAEDSRRINGADIYTIYI